MATANEDFFPRRWVIVALAFSLLCVGPSARAVMLLDLVPQVAGPYAPSSSVDVDVVLLNFEGVTVDLRLVTLDFSATDPALALPGAFNFQLVPPLVIDALYARFETMPKVDVVYTAPAPIPGFILSLPNTGSHTLGTLSVGLPAIDGVYTLDAVNTAAPNTTTGARIDYDFFSPTTVHTLNGNLRGGTLALRVVSGNGVPEPTTFLLLGLGLAGLGFARKRLH